jgi:hypothetical protein
MPIRNTDMTDLIEEKIALQEQNEALLGQLKWYHAITSILVELEGGVVKLPKNVVEGYDLSGARPDLRGRRVPFLCCGDCQ